jgi:hypothetical protein
MRCPHCNEEAGVLVGETEVVSIALKGTKDVAVDVGQKQYCDQCSKVVHEDRFRGVIAAPEAEKHQGEGHSLDLHAERVYPTDEDDELKVVFRLACSCGRDEARHEGKLRLIDEAPWTAPSSP